jgi:hypothetical protein
MKAIEREGRRRRRGDERDEPVSVCVSCLSLCGGPLRECDWVCGWSLCVGVCE